MIDHRRHHAAEAEIKPQLHHDEDEGKNDDNQGGDEPKPILKRFRDASVKISDMLGNSAISHAHQREIIA